MTGSTVAPNTLPALFIAGSKSEYCTDAHRPAIEASFPGAAGRPTACLEAGHWLHAEKPSEFVGLVNAFLDE